MCSLCRTFCMSSCSRISTTAICSLRLPRGPLSEPQRSPSPPLPIWPPWEPSPKGCSLCPVVREEKQNHKTQNGLQLYWKCLTVRFLPRFSPRSGVLLITGYIQTAQQHWEVTEMSPEMLPYSLRMTVSFLELQEHLEKAINTQPVKFSSKFCPSKKYDLS